MTSKLPTRRLSDIFNQTSMKSASRDAREAKRAMESIHAKELSTRFMRNMFLIDPKHLQLLCDHDNLKRARLFAIYKPPFCPMRRSEATENYHRVSVESYLNAVLKSREIYPTLLEIDQAASDKLRKKQKLDPLGSQAASDERGAGPPSVNVKVLNDLDLFSSGPVVISLTEVEGVPRTLRHGSVHYDVLIFGHETKLDRQEEVPLDALFPSVPQEVLQKAATDRERPMRATFTVDRIGYYSVHPVSLVKISIYSPVTSRPPEITKYVSSFRNTFVVGDMTALGKEDPSRANVTLKNGNILRGDCDFSRVFVHARQASIETEVFDAAGKAIATKSIDFHCKKCFEPLILGDRPVSIKQQKIQLIDGMWTALLG